MKRYDDFIDPVLIHTGQHYDENMSTVFFENLGLKQPDIYLGIGSGTQASQMARMLVEFERIMAENPPHLLISIGDSNSAVAGAVIAAKSKVLVAHLESGLRSFDTSQPEEINRLMIDKISDFQLVSESSSCQNLINEGFDEKSVFFVGNVLVDVILGFDKIIQTSGIIDTLGLLDSKYALLTVHKTENIDDPRVLKNILTGAGSVAERMPVIFPCHPKTRINIDKFDLRSYFGEKGIRLVEPVGYLDFVKLESGASLVLTDSGGVQEEATFLNVPCLTLRRSTERQVTLREGTNTLVGPFSEHIVTAAESILDGNIKKGQTPKYWDGKAAERIVEVVMNIRKDIFQPESIKDGTAKIKTVREALLAK